MPKITLQVFGVTKRRIKRCRGMAQPVRRSYPSEFLAQDKWAERLYSQGLQSDDHYFCPRFATVTDIKLRNERLAILKNRNF